MKISHPWLGLGCIAGLLGLVRSSAQAQNLADHRENQAVGRSHRDFPEKPQTTIDLSWHRLHCRGWPARCHQRPCLAGKNRYGKKETLTIFNGKSDRIEIREATKLAEDLDHDLVILKISGRPLTALTIGDSSRVREGETYAFTGFPIGMVLGLNAVTHKAMISAVTPVVFPQLSGQQLDKKVLIRLTAPYDVFQLDAIAYPGNSGSPLYQLDSGQVVGIINKVFIQETKETVLQKPSGISYAIPINHLQELLKKIRPE